MLVIDVLVTASTASTEVRARRLDPMRRDFDKIDKFGLGESFFFSNDFRRHAFAVDRKRNENSLAVVSPDAFSAKSDVFDFYIDRAQMRKPARSNRVTRDFNSQQILLRRPARQR